MLLIHHFKLKKNVLKIYVRYRSCKDIKKIVKYFEEHLIMFNKNINQGDIKQGDIKQIKINNHEINHYNIKINCERHDNPNGDIASTIKIILGRKLNHDNIEKMITIKIIFYQLMYLNHKQVKRFLILDNYKRSSYDGNQLILHQWDELLNGTIILDDDEAWMIKWRHEIRNRLEYYYNIACSIHSKYGKLIKKNDGYYWKK